MTNIHDLEEFSFFFFIPMKGYRSKMGITETFHAFVMRMESKLDIIPPP